MAPAATAQLTLTYGQWTQIGAVNDKPIMTPHVKEWKILLRYAGTNPGVGIVTGHELMSERGIRCIECCPSATFSIWARPMYPETDVVITLTKV